MASLRLGCLNLDKPQAYPGTTSKHLAAHEVKGNLADRLFDPRTIVANDPKVDLNPKIGAGEKTVRGTEDDKPYSMFLSWRN